MELGTLLIEQSRIDGKFRVLEMPNKNHADSRRQALLMLLVGG